MFLSIVISEQLLEAQQAAKQSHNEAEQLRGTQTIFPRNKWIADD